MTDSLITILNTKLITTGYFTKLFGLSEQVTKDGVTRPLLYKTRDERIEVTNFDELNGSVYWRKTGDIRVSESLEESLRSAEKLMQLSIPLKLVAVGNREMMPDDNNVTAENFARSLFGTIAANLNGNARRILRAKTVRLSLTSISDNARSIMTSEFPGSSQFELGENLIIVSLEMDAIISIYESCIPVDCDPISACEALLMSLSAAQKNECILPTYDFSDPVVFGNLTDEQIDALTDELCSGGGGGVVEIVNQFGDVMAEPECGTQYTVEELVTVRDTIDANSATIIDPIL